jgi:hypothetical protein
MAAMAIWTESVMFSVQTLSENVAVAAFLAGAALFRRDASAGRIALVGALMALAVMFRFQSAPALLAWAIFAAGRDKRAWAALTAGALPVVAAQALLDLSGGQTPFAWLWNNYRQNIAAGRMAGFGASHWTYFLTLPQALGVGVLTIPLLAALARRREPALVAAAVGNLLFHAFFAHKEERFLLLTTQPLLIVAALGSVDAHRQWTASRLVAAWAAASATLWLIPYYRVDFRDDGARTLLARATLKDPGVCGLVVPGEEYFYFGRAMLGSPKPIFLLPPGGPPVDSSRSRAPRPQPVTDAANAMFDYALAGPPGAPWTAGPCLGEGRFRMCLYRRPGSCHASSASQVYSFQNQLDLRGM